MKEAFSQVKAVLDSQGITTADLVRRIIEQGDRINAKSIYRLADPEEPLEKVDMRVISAICQALGVGIGDVLTYDEPRVIEQLTPDELSRMDALMARHSSTTNPLLPGELQELQTLVGRAEQVARNNARRLANRRRRLMRGSGRSVRKAAGEDGAGE